YYITFMNAREASFLALLKAEKREAFIEESLEKCQDHALAYELAPGAMRMRRLRDTQARRFSDKLPQKLAEKTLLRLTLYQCYFLDRIPLHAIANEMVALSKKVAGQRF